MGKVVFYMRRTFHRGIFRGGKKLSVEGGFRFPGII